MDTIPAHNVLFRIFDMSVYVLHRGAHLSILVYLLDYKFLHSGLNCLGSSDESEPNKRRMESGREGPREGLGFSYPG